MNELLEILYECGQIDVLQEIEEPEKEIEEREAMSKLNVKVVELKDKEEE